MPGILEPEIEKYLSSLLPVRDEVLGDMERYAKEHDIAIIGPDCGRLLYLMARIAGMTLESRWSDWNGQPFDHESTSHVSVWRKG